MPDKDPAAANHEQSARRLQRDDALVSEDLRSSTLRLFSRARRGDSRALSLLFARNLPRLMRWAHGRIPKWARGFSDTADVVQDALLQTVRRLTHFEPRRDQALQAYLRMAIDNRIRDEIRRFKRRPPEEGLNEGEAVRSNDLSPLHALIDQEKWGHYKRSVGRLDNDQRRLVVGRAKLGYTYQQLALVTGRPSPDAARAALRRGPRLAEEMKHG